jgi:membrane peptidoglycan carboxypeptidase
MRAVRVLRPEVGLRAWPRLAGSRLGLRPSRPRWVRAAAACALLATIVAWEAHTSTLQAWLLPRYASQLTYVLAPGPSPHMAFPRPGGPLDDQRGYSRLPDLVRRLQAAGYGVTAQARQSPALSRLVRWGVSPPYREPAVAGLVLRDAAGQVLYDAQGGRELFRTFEEIPPLVVTSLLFLENRALGRASDPHANPAVDWRRLARAGLAYAARELGLPVKSAGGSTLAVQMEKYRHSPHGRTGSPLDKLRQLAAASLKAYREGPDTREERRAVVVDYLNTVPLAAAPGYGEVFGLGPGLRAWFGLDPAATLAALREEAPGPERARAFKHVLALLYAVRAPSRYLLEQRSQLEARVAAAADRLVAAGLLDPELRRAMDGIRLEFRGAASGAAAAPTRPWAARRLREELRHLLGLPGAYELEQLHLEVDTTVDGALQDATARLFRALEDPGFVAAHGLRAERLLPRGDPRRVAYSLLLFERTPRGDVLRVDADNLDRPFALNTGMKLELGSTAKLRTLVHYLEVMADLHAELAAGDPQGLEHRARTARDPLTRWAAEVLGRDPGLDLERFLELALERRYPATPHEVFYTGGGLHTFRNFDPHEDGQTFTVREALVRSTNLVFVRLLRDLVRFHEARLPYDAAAVLSQSEHPERQRLLREIADEETRQHLARAWTIYRGLGAPAVLARLLGPQGRSPRRLALAFFAWHPGAGIEDFRAWLHAHHLAVPERELPALVRAYGRGELTLSDFAYLLGRHPLELWVAGEVARNPGITWSELLDRSLAARQAASRWLFQTRHRAAQDLRLRARIERDAFERMAAAWQRLGFPFGRLVPSLATALGASADRPLALAELMGILVNDGLRRPARTLERLHFAPGTPYHTVLEGTPLPEERVLPAAVARAVRRVLAESVARGTAHRVHGVFIGPGGLPVEVGGKTGSGDNRYETFAPGGRLLSSRAVSRTGAFVFYIGDRYYGVVTASVVGSEAEHYAFTSALPLTVLRLLAPELNRRLAAGGPARSTLQGS